MNERSEGCRVYQAVSRHGSLCDLEDLLRHGHSPDQSPPTCPPPLHRAVRFNRPDMVLALLKAGCKAAMNKRLEQHHSSIICLAAHLKMTDVVLNLCLHPQVNVFAVDSHLQTIAHLAVANRNYQLLKCLPSYCRNCRKFLTLRDGMCLTPLHLAASLGDLTVLKLLYNMDLCCEFDTPSRQFTFDHQDLEIVLENGRIDSQTSALIKGSHNVKTQLESVCQSPVSDDSDHIAVDWHIAREQPTHCDQVESNPETLSVSQLSLSENEQPTHCAQVESNPETLSVSQLSLSENEQPTHCDQVESNPETLSVSQLSLSENEQPTHCDQVESSPETLSVSQLSLSENEQPTDCESSPETLSVSQLSLLLENEQPTLCDQLESSPETLSVSELSMSENEYATKQPSWYMASGLYTGSHQHTSFHNNSAVGKQHLFQQGSRLNTEPYEQTVVNTEPYENLLNTDSFQQTLPHTLPYEQSLLHKDAESFSHPMLAVEQPMGHWAKVNLPVLGSKDTMLHLAARGHHLEVMQFLISQGADVNARNMMNNTPLHLLVMYGRADHRAVACAKLLLNAGADCSLKGTYISGLPKRPEKCRQEPKSSKHAHKEVTVGMIAAIRNRVVYLKLLGEAGDRFDDLDFMHMTPLMLALCHSSEEAAHYLLTYWPEPSCRHAWRDKQGNTGLHHVAHCWSRGGQLMQLMLSQGYGAALLVEDECYPSTDSYCQDMAKTCVRCCRPQIYTPLTWAIRLHHLDILKTLLRFDPSLLLHDFKQFSHSPMHTAVRWIPNKQCMPFIDILLEHGCDGNRQILNQSPYQFAQEVSGGLGGFCPLSALYLKKKLGMFFVEPGCGVNRGISNCKGSLHFSRKSRVMCLRDMCLDRVRQIVKTRKIRYHDEICSLPLPPVLIRRLLFQN